MLFYWGLKIPLLSHLLLNQACSLKSPCSSEHMLSFIQQPINVRLIRNGPPKQVSVKQVPRQGLRKEDDSSGPKASVDARATRDKGILCRIS